MANMEYCRFENTLRDLQDCLDHINDDDLAVLEANARLELVEVCKQIVEESE